jgi:hypothetical protein
MMKLTKRGREKLAARCEVELFHAPATIKFADGRVWDDVWCAWMEEDGLHVLRDTHPYLWLFEGAYPVRQSLELEGVESHDVVIREMELHYSGVDD